MLWLAAALVSGLWVWREAGAVLDSALQETGERLALLPAAAFQQPDTAELLARSGEHGEHVLYQVFEAGTLRWRSHRAPDQAIAPDAPTGLSDSAGYRLFTLHDGARRVQVAEPHAHRLALARGMLLALFATLVPLLLLAALVVDWTLHRGFGQLERVREQWLQRALPGLSPPTDTQRIPAELQPWVDSVSELMARMRRLLDAERSFAAHAAHELRTPVAAARAQLQRLASGAARPVDCASPEAQAPLHAALQQLDRMGALCTRLLQLSRVEAGLALLREPVDLNQLAALVIEEAVGGDADRLLLLPSETPVWVMADLDGLAIALRNLIDNALRHGRGEVLVLVLPDGLRVQDDGPGVPPDRLASLGQPWQHGTTKRPLLGTGVGLALVKRIAQDSDGRLELKSPGPSGRGFVATLHLQACSPP